MNKLTKLFAFAMMFVAGIASFTSCNEDPCKDVVCLNNGTCDAGNCLCAAGYEGTDCGTMSRDKFIGTYNFSDICTSGTYTGSLVIATSASGVDKALVTNLGGFNPTSSSAATIDGNTISSGTFTIVNGATTYTITGFTGTYTNGVITGTYVSNDGTTTDNCAFTWTKQ